MQALLIYANSGSSSSAEKKLHISRLGNILMRILYF